MSVNSLYRYPATAGSDIKVQSCGLQSKTTSEINTLTPTPGELVYNSTTNNLEYSDGTNWNQVYSSATGSTNYCFFRAHLSTPQTITAANTTVVFDTIDDNNFNGIPGGLTGDQFNAPITGVYQFNLTSVLDGVTGTVTEPAISIIRNTSDVVALTPNGTSSTALSAANEIYYGLGGCILLEIGDIVRVITTANSISPGVNEYAVAANTYYTGTLVTTVPDA